MPAHSHKLSTLPIEFSLRVLAADTFHYLLHRSAFLAFLRLPDTSNPSFQPPAKRAMQTAQEGPKRGRLDPLPLNWQHVPMTRDFPFPVPNQPFFYRHAAGTRQISYEPHGHDKCARCSRPFTSASYFDAHYFSHRYNHTPLFVRYDSGTGKWEWFHHSRPRSVVGEESETNVASDDSDGES